MTGGWQQFADSLPKTAAAETDGAEVCRLCGDPVPARKDMIAFARQCFGAFYAQPARASDVVPAEDIEMAIQTIDNYYTNRREDRMVADPSALANALADEFDKARADAIHLASTTEWRPLSPVVAGRFAGGPPAAAARLFAPSGSGWPRLRISIAGGESSGYSVIVCVKAIDCPDTPWQTIPIPRPLLRQAAALLAEAIG